MSNEQDDKHYLSATYQLTLGHLISAVPLLWSEGTLLSVLLDLVSADPPTLPDTKGFTEARIFDTYSPYVALYGSKEAQEAFLQGDQVIVALRMSANTRVNGGKGEYSSRMAIIWRETKAAETTKTISKTRRDSTLAYARRPRFALSQQRAP